MDNFKITKTILENIKEQDNKIEQCIDVVNNFTKEQELNQEMILNEQIRQQNELIRQEQYNNNENRFAEINQQLDNITQQQSDLFQSVSNGKKMIASAITDKGVATSENDTFENMANNILLISGGDTPGTGGGTENPDIPGTGGGTENPDIPGTGGGTENPDIPGTGGDSGEDTPGSGEIETLTLNYEFNNNEKGVAMGNITLATTNNDFGDYEICWGDNNEKLSSYMPITTLSLSEDNTTSTYNIALDEIVIPGEVEKIVAIKDNEIKKSYNIPSSKLINDTKLYSFGVISDIHHQANDTYGARHDSPIVYGILNNLVDFVCACGDLTVQRNVLSELQEFKEYKDNYLTVPFYSCNGNHDTGFTNEQWNTYVGHNLNYSFLRNNDLFIFMSMSSSDGYQDRDIQYLTDIVSNNNDKRIFVFMHFPIPGYAGLKNGQYYGFASGDSKINTLVDLITNNKNVIMFSGHSHFKFDCQLQESQMNIYDKNNTVAATISVPSSSLPREYNGRYLYDDTHSEGYIVDVYKDYIVVKGIDFINNVYVPYASYKVVHTLQSFGSIVTDFSSLTVDEGANIVLNVKLNKQPTSDQIVSLTKDNANITLDKTSLTFTPANWDAYQTVTITGVHDVDSYINNTATITLSTNYSLKNVTVTVNNIDIGHSGEPYEITNFTLDGTNYLDTQLDPEKHYGENYYMAIDVNSTKVYDSSERVEIIHYALLSSPYNGIFFEKNKNSTAYRVVSGSNTFELPQFNNQYLGRMKLFFAIEGSTLTVYNSSMTVIRSVNYLPGATDRRLYLGARVNGNTVDRNFTGVINKFKLWATRPTDEEVIQYLS